MSVSIKSLAKTALLSADGEELGKVREVLLERRQGRIAYLLIEPNPQHAPGGEDGRRLFPLPWPEVSFDEERESFQLVGTSERLWRGPSSLEQEPIDWQDRVWAERLQEHYGQQPDWTVR